MYKIKHYNIVYKKLIPQKKKIIKIENISNVYVFISQMQIPSLT